MKGRFIAIAATIALFTTPIWTAGVVMAQTAPSCAGTDIQCLLQNLGQTTSDINDTKWRDQTLREIAKLYAANGDAENALAQLGKIQTPDTRALTIRGIGMAIARLHWDTVQYTPVFNALKNEADKIDHPPSHAIALTYLAMSQAYAGDNDGAYKTAESMTNPALRNKAFGENAEIQAARGELDTALHSLDAVEDAQYRDKQALIVAKILTDLAAYDKAVKMADSIANPYSRAQAMLYIAAKQITPHESDLGQKDE